MIDLFLLQVLSCFLMTGAIWLVQILLYPNFKIVGRDDFKRYHQFHTNRITWFVGPVMLVELLSGIGLYLLSQNSVYFWNLVSIFSIFALTAFVNVPTHNRLSFEIFKAKSRLIYYNWPRTIIWTLRAVFCYWLLRQQLNGGAL